MSYDLHHTPGIRPRGGWTVCEPANLLRMAAPAARRWRATRRRQP